MTASFESLAERLDAISDELAESALAELSTAVRRGEQKRPAAERSLTQARRAVEKAAHLLRRLDAGPDSDPDLGSDSA
jgi:hypothetical protein